MEECRKEQAVLAEQSRSLQERKQELEERFGKEALGRKIEEELEQAQKAYQAAKQAVQSLKEARQRRAALEEQAARTAGAPEQCDRTGTAAARTACEHKKPAFKRCGRALSWRYSQRSWKLSAKEKQEEMERLQQAIEQAQTQKEHAQQQLAAAKARLDSAAEEQEKAEAAHALARENLHKAFLPRDSQMSRLLRRRGFRKSRLRNTEKK